MTIKVKVTPTAINAKVTPQKNLLVTKFSLNAGLVNIGDISDIDVSSVSDGSVLIYNGNTSIWEAKVEVKNNNTIINGGFY